MDRLPKEPFLEIMSYLTISEKITCMRVCREWYESILRRILFFGSLTFGIQEFNKPTNFNKLRKAIAFYTKHRHLRRQVLCLNINGRLDIDLLLSIPNVFPRVKSLTFKDTYNNIPYEENAGIPLQSDLCASFRKLKHLENLEISAGCKGYQQFPFAAYILGSTVFSDLTTVTISVSKNFGTIDTSDERVIPARPIMDNINCLPALLELDLTGFEIGILDMEKLHEGATLLTKLKLNSVQLASPERDGITVYENGDYIVMENMGAVQIINTSTNQQYSRMKKPRIAVYIPLYEDEEDDDNNYGSNVDSLVKMEEDLSPKILLPDHSLYAPEKIKRAEHLQHLVIYIKENGKDPVKHYQESTLVKWLTYVGVKYSNLDHVSLTSAPLSNVVPPAESLDDLVIKIASHMKCIKYINLIGMYPLTEKIVKGFDNIDAKWLSLQTRLDDTFAEECEFLRESKQGENIQKWTITDWTSIPLNVEVIVPSIISTGQTFKSLVTLELIGQQYKHHFLVDIVYYLPWVETLLMGAIYFQNEIVSVLAKPMIHPSRLKVLRVGFICREEYPHYYFNCLFSIIAKTCLELEHFTLRGTMLRCCGGMLDLNLRNLEYLRDVTIDLQGVRYFKLNSNILKKPTRVYWARQNTFYTGEEEWNDVDGHVAYINLTWKGNIILDLEG